MGHSRRQKWILAKIQKNVLVEYFPQLFRLCCLEMTLYLILQQYLIRFTSFDKYLKSVTEPTINVTDLNLSFNETFQWTFSGLNVNIARCSMDSVHIALQSNNTEELEESSTITIHNSSFGSLDLNSRTKAEITGCYMNGQYKPQPTLLTLNNSKLSIQNCHFENFISKNGSTILFGHNNSHITIENSIFIQHKSSKGVLLLQDNSSMYISSSLFSQNIAFTLGYSTITLKDRIHLVVDDAVFKNNSAFNGGVTFVIDQCQVKLTNSTFSSNEAITGKIVNILTKQRAEMVAHSLYNNRTYTTIGSMLFNLTSSHNKDNEDIATLPLVRQSEKAPVQQGILPGIGGAVAVAIHSELIVKNCVFKNNSALFVGAISAAYNVTLDIEETKFDGNKALSDSGAIDVQHRTHLRIKNSVFNDNISQRYGGAIVGGRNSKIDIQDTNFTGNRAVQGGAIEADQESYLLVTNCTFEDNYATKMGGAIFGGLDLVCEIDKSSFFNNSAPQGGAINTQQKANVKIRNSKLEHNVASDAGGAIVSAVDVNLILQETNFAFNGASNEAGALVVLQSKCHIARCSFHSNTAKTVGGAIGIGGAASVAIKDTNFTKNNSTDGGVIYLDSNSKLQTNMCSFGENFAKQSGGAIQLTEYATGVIRNCHFLSNYAENGGAVHLNFPENVSVLGTLFERNVASNKGGAVRINGQTNITMNNITCVGNHSPKGGCLYIQYVILRLKNSEISENFGHHFASGIVAYYSRIQVGSQIKIYLFNSIISKKK